MPKDKEINVLAMVRDGHNHIFLYRDGQEADALRALGRAAADPETNFSWYDASVLGQKVRASLPAQQPVKPLTSQAIHEMYRRLKGNRNG